mmetsp:Transcript_25474/g.41060  ORF Transcript_25474/g.41060 Transcript_25474/m.41060 type:complete len:235 (+) Transcript_25474:254-958(+)
MSSSSFSRRKRRENDSSQLISTTVYNHNLLTTCFSKTRRATFSVSEDHKHILVCIHPPITFLSYLFVSTHDMFFHAMVPACTHSQPQQISDPTLGVQLTILLERQDSAAVLLFPSSIITEGVRKILLCRLHRPTRVQRLVVVESLSGGSGKSSIIACYLSLHGRILSDIDFTTAILRFLGVLFHGLHLNCRHRQHLFCYHCTSHGGSGSCAGRCKSLRTNSSNRQIHDHSMSSE